MPAASGSSTSPERLLADAHARANAGDSAGAQSLLRKIPRQSGVAVDAARLLGILRFADGDHTEAARLFLRVLKSPAPLAIDHVNHGLALAALGRLAKAEAAYRTALTLEPELLDGWFNLGNLYRTRGDLDADQPR